MVVALDGPAGSGKSTVAKRIAMALNGVFINSGAMYRHITLQALTAQKIGDTAFYEDIATTTEWSLGLNSLLINGEMPSNSLHSDTIDAHVSMVSSHGPLRLLINNAIRAMAQQRTIVVEGRDMTTVAFPDAQHKFYLDASVEARAERRFLQGTSTLDRISLLEEIKKRDALDMAKAEGALRYDVSTTYIDTSGLTMDEVCAKILESIQGR